uniref:Endonuclease/exonuclease/phosphatase domain-containing protein n=1 Tax=Chlorobium chlorochromatii (strain CaD3) TaxID=340177 RepID=Q3AQN7_CHLCH
MGCITALTLSSALHAASSSPQKIGILWWNVENLFDTQDDPAKRDEDFTPNGKLQWSEKKLYLKQMRIRDLLGALAADKQMGSLPDIIGFAEVENKTVFEQTLQGVKTGSYKSVYYNSRDPRGIDVALAYNSATLKLQHSKAYSVPLKHPTRPVVVASFMVGRHPLHLLLNHWPSRAFDAELSEPNRIAAATIARHIVDSLLTANPKADVVVMGDMNDEATNRSLANTLGSSMDGVQVKAAKGKLLYNCWSGYNGIGSYYYRSKWQKIDHMLLTHGMLDRTGFYVTKEAFRCIDYPALLKSSGKGTWSTYEKRVYKGGYADHLPLYLKVSVE